MALADWPAALGARQFQKKKKKKEKSQLSTTGMIESNNK